jgi:mono/diheme cytochrome c family protein
MTYDQGVGVAAGGQFARTAHGAATLEADLAGGMRPADAGRVAFSRGELGCASCHGDQAQGLRGPDLAGGAELTQFRHVHGDGLFPPAAVSDRDFAAVNAWLGTLSAPRRRAR